MSGGFIKHLPKDAQIWSAQAIAGIIVADGKVTDSELEILKETIGFLQDRNRINEIVAQVRNRNLPNLPALKCERKLASNILISLVAVAITDDHVSQKEMEYFTYIAGKLGFDSHYAHMVMSWGREFSKLNQQKKRLIKMGEEQKPVYVNL